MVLNCQQSLAARVVARAQSQIGVREWGANNCGEQIREYFTAAPTWTGRILTKGMWCAAFVSWCYREAAADLGVEMPFEGSSGAKMLFNNAKRAGRRVSPRESPNPGDIVLVSRGFRRFHVGIVVTTVAQTTFWTIEGNRGPYPATVDFFKRQSGEFGLLGFARPA